MFIHSTFTSLSTCLYSSTDKVNEMGAPLSLRLTNDTQLKYSYDQKHARAQLLIHGRAFAFVDDDPAIAKEGVYRAALCRDILSTILEQNHIPIYLRRNMEGFLSTWQEMSSLPPLRSNNVQLSVKEPADKWNIASRQEQTSFSIPPRTALPANQPSSIQSKGHVSGSSQQNPSTAMLPHGLTISQTQWPTGPTRETCKANIAAPSEIEVWHILLSQPTPSSAKQRLTLLCRTHFSQTRRPEVYQPYYAFEFIGDTARISLAKELFKIERHIGSSEKHLRTIGAAWLEEELCREAISSRIFAKFQKNKMPKATVRPRFLDVARRYEDFDTLLPNPKPQMSSRTPSTLSIVGSSVRNAGSHALELPNAEASPSKPSSSRSVESKVAHSSPTSVRGENVNAARSITTSAHMSGQTSQGFDLNTPTFRSANTSSANLIVPTHQLPASTSAYISAPDQLLASIGKTRDPAPRQPQTAISQLHSAAISTTAAEPGSGPPGKRKRGLEGTRQSSPESGQKRSDTAVDSKRSRRSSTTADPIADHGVGISHIEVDSVDLTQKMTLPN